MHPSLNPRPGWPGSFLKRAARPLLDLLYPPRCAACASRIPESRSEDFCLPCRHELEAVQAPFCGTCGEPFTGRLSAGFSCPNCAGHPFAFDFAISAWQSEGPLREAIHRFKYQHRLHLRLALSRKLHDALADPRLAAARVPGAAETWRIVPVPLHPRRQRERGFNQSAELARLLARFTGLPFHGLLRRTRYTTAQAALNRQQRLANLAGAFTVTRQAPKLLAGKNILLIDDVFTTGSTAHECASVLKKSAGAARVIVLTVAR